MTPHARSGLAWLALSLSIACKGSGGEPVSNTAGAGGASAGSDGASGNAASGAGAGGVIVGGAPGGSANGGGSAAGAGGLNGGSGGGAGGASGGGTNGGGTNGGGTSTFPPEVSKPRIMIVGDSISAGPGCYKKYLLQNLTTNRYARFEFVGQYADDCGSSVRHSAVSCSTAEQYTQPTFTMPNCSQGTSFPGLSTLMTTHHPDLLMLQLGVNDVWNGRTTEQTLASYEKLVEQARAQNPRIVLVVAQIQKIRPDCGTDDTVQKRAQALVEALPPWAARLGTAQSPLFLADLWTNSDWSMAETLDCVHPNDVGAQRMGLNWFNALQPILKPD